MTPWLGLDRLFFFIARQFLALWTRANVQPQSPEELGLDPSSPVVRYATGNCPRRAPPCRWRRKPFPAAIFISTGAGLSPAVKE